MRVSNATDVAAAGRDARRRARELGFGEAETAELELVARELAANLVKHAGGGSLTCRRIALDGRHGVSLESVDTGPGISDPEAALTDGVTTIAGSLGCGLGTVNRLTDSLTFSAGPKGRGLRLTAHRWLDATPAEAADRSRLDVAAATRPRPGCAANGDAFVVEQRGTRHFAAVIDGLGHGVQAQRAAHRAQSYAAQHWEESFVTLFRGVSNSCHGTRGVVMTALRIDTDTDRATLAGIGNVEALLSGFDGPRMLVRRGILGTNPPTPATAELHMQPPAVAVLHSDGIARAGGWDGELSRCLQEGAHPSAQRLLRERGREHDDATVLVVTCRTGADS
jgi:anti-sigma regulatory factor (Ser/Thr protein kinase)